MLAHGLAVRRMDGDRRQLRKEGRMEGRKEGRKEEMQMG
jgi:hypothetical protein